MKLLRYVVLLSIVIFFMGSLNLSAQEVEKGEYNVFTFGDSLTLPGTPTEIYDAITGDISGWWDHSFSENPKEFYIEPKPGGKFMEIFDDEGNGVQHATVIYCNRGEVLRLDGPLGLSGRAITFITSIYFSEQNGQKTLLKYEVHVSGEINYKLAGIVKDVWKHFIFERFKPYIESGAHKNK